LWFEEVYKENYFKKGDWITIINKKDDINKTLNKSFEIQHVESKDFNNNEDVRYLINHDCKGIYHKCVRLATEEEIKTAQTIIVPMTASNGNFEIEVSKGKIFYRPDNKELSIYFIKYIINAFINFDNLSTEFPYKISTDTITVGCKGKTLQKDWKKVLDAYNSFQ
jgi:hypothetical protein